MLFVCLGKHRTLPPDDRSAFDNVYPVQLLQHCRDDVMPVSTQNDSCVAGSLPRTVGSRQASSHFNMISHVTDPHPQSHWISWIELEDQPINHGDVAVSEDSRSACDEVTGLKAAGSMFDDSLHECRSEVTEDYYSPSRRQCEVISHADSGNNSSSWTTSREDRDDRTPRSTQVHRARATVTRTLLVCGAVG